MTAIRMFAQNRLAKYVASNPRLIGVLFALTLLLLQAGNVAARVTHYTITGP